MIRQEAGHKTSGEARLLVVTDIDRLAPIVRDCFAPNQITGVRSYLAAIAEIRKAPTSAVLVGYDGSCRNPQAAIAAIKAVAGDAPVVVCCEPAYEPVARRLVTHGADDYLIFPPEAADLERALGIPSGRTRQSWIEAPVVAPTPSAEELARLADVLPRLTAGEEGTLEAMAVLICTALNAESAMVVLDGKAGRAVLGHRRPSGGLPAGPRTSTAGPRIPSRSSDDDPFRAILIEPITINEQRAGQIRVGASNTGGFTHEDTAKLRHYGVLFGRMIQGARRARDWQRLAMTDDLTGLPNRRHVMDFLEQKLELAAKAHSTVSLLFFDIDDFKHYNDQYGHDAGDAILCDIGRLFGQCSRDSDLVARFGGDEFVVVFWDPEGPRGAGSRRPLGVLDVLQRFRQALEKHTFTRLGSEATGCLTISGGIAHYPWDAHSAIDLLEAADRALLQAKEAGKNRFWIIGDGDAVA